MGFTQTPPQFQCVFSDIANPATPGFVASEAEWIAQRNQLPAVHGPNLGRLRKFDRQVFVSGKLIMPDGTDVRHWGFRGDDGSETFPSAPIRLNSGDLGQVTLKPA